MYKTYQKLITEYQSEAQESISDLRYIIERLPNDLENSQKIEPLFRATFALKGGLGILGYGNSVPYFIDRICRYLLDNPQVFDEFIRSKLLEMVDILETIIQGVTYPTTPEDYKRLTELNNQGLSLSKTLEAVYSMNLQN